MFNLEEQLQYQPPCDIIFNVLSSLGHMQEVGNLKWHTGG